MEFILTYPYTFGPSTIPLPTLADLPLRSPANAYCTDIFLLPVLAPRAVSCDVVEPGAMPFYSARY